MNKNIVLILAASFCFMACTMLVTPLITGFAGSLGASGLIMGLAGGVMNFCSLLCRPVAGNLADKISKYKLATAGAVLLLIGCAGYAMSASSYMLIGARLIQGIGFACCTVCMSTWMANMLPREKIGSGMGIYGTMNALGMAVAPVIGVQVSEQFGYQEAFWAAGGFALLMLVLIQFVTDKGLPDPAVAARTENSLQIIDQKVIPVALIVMMFTIPYFANQMFMVNYLEAKGAAASSSVYFPVYAGVLLFLRLSLKKYFDQWSYTSFILINGACAAGCMLCLTFVEGNVLLIAAAVFMAGGYGINCSVSQSTAILLAGPGRRGLANSTYYVGLDLGMTIGPILGGVLYGNLPLSWFYPVLMITVPLAILILAGWNRSGKK